MDPFIVYCVYSEGLPLSRCFTSFSDNSPPHYFTILVSPFSLTLTRVNGWGRWPGAAVNPEEANTFTMYVTANGNESANFQAASPGTLPLARWSGMREVVLGPGLI